MTARARRRHVNRRLRVCLTSADLHPDSSEGQSAEQTLAAVCPASAPPPPAAAGPPGRAHRPANLGTRVTSAPLIRRRYLCSRLPHRHPSAQPPCHLFCKFTLSLSIGLCPSSPPPSLLFFLPPSLPLSLPSRSALIGFRSWKYYVHNEYNCVIAGIIARANAVFCNCQVNEVLLS